ncbi:MAG: hypothetical protein D6681_11260 [Calditrichaeota bacterium]|nr:MAG: hypothetical protein D6681_11260 [Calditrichota bacterium]
MQELLFDNRMWPMIGILLLLILTVQMYLLMRIRNILQAISMNFDSVLYFLRKFAHSQSPQKSDKSAPRMRKTCQFCKHRLAYINTSKTRSTEEDFYHVCGLKNIHISLNDSCDQFEKDEEMIP